MKCLNCGQEFTERTVIQKFCSARCGRQYRQSHDISKEYPSITFECTNCGKIVVTEGGTGDRRTRFCRQSCEKKFWRHPPWEHETEKTNFHSTQEYLSWERRTNE